LFNCLEWIASILFQSSQYQPLLRIKSHRYQRGVRRRIRSSGGARSPAQKKGLTMICKPGKQTIPEWLAKHKKDGKKELSDPTVTDFAEHLIGSEFSQLKTISAALALLDSLRKRPPLFNLGRVFVTPGAIDLLDRMGTDINDYLVRHVIGDWGDVPSHDATANEQALKHGNRIMSVYKLGQRKEPLWLITDHDRSITTCLLPEEY
jgi:hypothetical protein